VAKRGGSQQAGDEERAMNTIWVKSSLSFSNGNCVEVARLPGGAVGVRDSRDPGGPVLRFTPGEWGVFAGRARLGEFDRCGAAPGSEPSSARPGEAVHAARPDVALPAEAVEFPVSHAAEKCVPFG
jgi:hypothetical protein